MSSALTKKDLHEMFNSVFEENKKLNMLLKASEKFQNPMPFLEHLLKNVSDGGFNPRMMFLGLHQMYDYEYATKEDVEREFTAWMNSPVDVTMFVAGKDDEGKSFFAQKSFDVNEKKDPIFEDSIMVAFDNGKYDNPEDVIVTLVKTLRNGEKESKVLCK